MCVTFIHKQRHHGVEITELQSEKKEIKLILA